MKILNKSKKYKLYCKNCKKLTKVGHTELIVGVLYSPYAVPIETFWCGECNNVYNSLVLTLQSRRKKVNLPKRVEVADYHEFDYMQDMYQELDKNIKVKEIGFNGRYIGIVYFHKQDNFFKELKKEIMAEIEGYDDEYNKAYKKYKRDIHDTKRDIHDLY